MPNQSARVDVKTNGQTLTVTFTGPTSPAFYTDAALTASVTLPVTVTADVTYYTGNFGPYTVSAKQSDGTELWGRVERIAPDVPTVIEPLPTSAQMAADLAFSPSSELEVLSAGIISTHPRFMLATNSTMTSQQLRVSCFTAPRSMTVATVACYTGSTAAGATPSLIRYGLYTMAANDDATLVASTTNDTALLVGTFTRQPKALTTPYAITKGTRYAIGLLVVTAAAAPNIATATPLLSGNIGNAVPRITWEVTGQADLPASLAVGSQTAAAAQPYFELSV